MALNTAESVIKFQANVSHDEAQRQLGICNSCRYCEGYCGAFQALTRYRSFDKATVSHMANLCHNCRGCYYACQYTEPHEFALNIPALFANVRAQSWEQHVRPQSVTRLMQQKVWPYIVLVVLFVFVLSAGIGAPWWSDSAFYTSISHNTMVLLFLPLFVLPLVAVAFGVRSYWKSVGGQSLRLKDLTSAFKSAATLKQLNGGQGQGCNYESGERFSSYRRWAHQATMYGFLLCFLSTSTATLYHYLLNYPAPYPFFSLPKLAGVVGGILLSVGCAALLYLKQRADDAQGSVKRQSAEVAFVSLLLAVGVTGLLLYWTKGTGFAAGLLIIHLAVVAAFFVSIPYSKMTHGFFRMAALCREEQLKSSSPDQ